MATPSADNVLIALAELASKSLRDERT